MLLSKQNDNYQGNKGYMQWVIYKEKSVYFISLDPWVWIVPVNNRKGAFWEARVANSLLSQLLLDDLINRQN